MPEIFLHRDSYKENITFKVAIVSWVLLGMPSHLHIYQG